MQPDEQHAAEEGGAYVLTETAATQLLVEDGRVKGVRSGDKGRGKDGSPTCATVRPVIGWQLSERR